MNIRAYEIIVAGLLVASLFLGWRCLPLTARVPRT